MRHFCTYFDRRYLLQGLTLYRSLAAHAGPLTFHVLCFDAESLETLSRLALPDVRPVALEELERVVPDLLAVKGTRSRVEYYFTCSPAWPKFLLDRYPEIDRITYVDADLFFFRDPGPIYEELGEESVLIVGHRFPEHLRYKEVHGVYNVGLLVFRNDRRGRACLEWWAGRCIEWCHDRVEVNRFADQKYLDDWPQRFDGLVVLRHKGAGLAPWNWMNYRIETGENGATVDGEPLIFYHYQGLKIITRKLFDPGTLGYGPMPRPLRRWVYGRYLSAVSETERWVRGKVTDFEVAYPGISSRYYGWNLFMHRLRKGQIMIAPG